MPPIENNKEASPGAATAPGLLHPGTNTAMDPQQRMCVSIITRRKQPLNLEALGGRVLSYEEFDAKYGGDPADFKSLRDFARSHGLSVDEPSSSLARRTLMLCGTAFQMEAAFCVKLLNCESEDGKVTFHAP